MTQAYALKTPELSMRAQKLAHDHLNWYAF